MDTDDDALHAKLAICCRMVEHLSMRAMEVRNHRPQDVKAENGFGIGHEFLFAFKECLYVLHVVVRDNGGISLLNAGCERSLRDIYARIGQLGRTLAKMPKIIENSLRETAFAKEVEKGLRAMHNCLSFFGSAIAAICNGKYNKEEHGEFTKYSLFKGCPRLFARTAESCDAHRKEIATLFHQMFTENDRYAAFRKYVDNFNEGRHSKSGNPIYKCLFYFINKSHLERYLM